MNFFSKVVNCRYKFSIDKKSDILLFTGWENKELFLKELKEYSIVFVHRKSYEVNIFYLAIAFFLKFIFNEKLKISYIRAHTFFVKPKIILTTYDTEEMVFSFKKYFNIKTFIIQLNHQNAYQGWWGKSKAKYEVDEIFVYGEDYKKLFQKYLKANYNIIGAFRNNSFLMKNSKKKKEKSISYISQYRKGYSFGGTLKTKNSYIVDIMILKFLEKYCLKRKLILKINLFSSPNLPGRRGLWYKNKNEINFFKSLKLKCKHKYITPKGVMGSYKNLILSNCKTIVAADSNITYEMFVRGKKCVFFSIRDWDHKAKSGNFGWPGKYPNAGFCWNNKYSEKNFEKTLNRVISMSNQTWEKLSKKYLRKIIVHDNGNKIFKKKIRDAIL